MYKHTLTEKAGRQSLSLIRGILTRNCCKAAKYTSLNNFLPHTHNVRAPSHNSPTCNSLTGAQIAFWSFWMKKAHGPKPPFVLKTLNPPSTANAPPAQEFDFTMTPATAAHTLHPSTQAGSHILGEKPSFCIMLSCATCRKLQQAY